MNKFFGIGMAVVATTIMTLVACDNTPKQKGKDGYYFEKESFTRTEFPVEVVLVKDAAAMEAEVKRRNNLHGSVESSKIVAAFSVIRMNDPKCTIYMIDPKNKYEPEYIGHEFVHCIYGVWHSEPQK